MTLHSSDIRITTSLPDAMGIIGEALGIGEESQDRCPACGMTLSEDGPHALAQVVVTCTVGWLGNLPFLLCVDCSGGGGLYSVRASYTLRTISDLLETALAEVIHTRNVDRLAEDALARRN